MNIPQSLDFLDAISGHLQRERTSSADRPVRLATVDPAYNAFATPGYPDAVPPARVTFDGESALSGKAYPVAQGVVLRAGQRVLLIPQGNGYILTDHVTPQTLQGFWADSSADYGVELGGGNYFDSFDGLYLETDATVQGVLQVGGRRAATAPGSGKIHWGNFTPTTDANGLATITHGAPFTPTFVLAGQWGAASGTSPCHVFYINGSATSTTAQVRVFLTTGAALASSSVGVTLLLAA